MVAMGSRDQEEWEREKQFNNRGGNNQRLDNQPEGYVGQKQYFNQGQRGNKVVWEPIKMSYLNATVEKIWEAIILMEEISAPPNAGNEPLPGRRNREFCAYHRFHGHTTNNCRDIKKIILRMIDQGKLDQFLVQQQHNLPPPPPEGRTQGTKTGRNTYLIEKQLISFNAEEVPGGGEPHESPLVVKLEINPKAKTDEEEDANTWAINRILIDPGSSVDILFYHTYKTMGGRDEELISSTYKIYGFNGTDNKPKGEITKRIPLKNISSEIVFCVVDVESPYNSLIAIPWLRGILGVASTFHQCIKFPLPQGV
ncbi:uncharacterized protein LOC113337523 [Papaver somniferum]|uniref:uncharacterized protein LOC113337523 n=1 Tax=Papaver somniferum TaxID=3469 RepID=UPI000E6F95A1|nr:uncharacterized protein LOC113337523 [Papaver somniferum]